MDEWLYETPAYIHDRNIEASARLLELLQLHHSPAGQEPAPLPAKAKVEAEPIIIPPAKGESPDSSKLPGIPSGCWFSIVDEVEETRSVSISEIKRTVASYFKISLRELDSARRTAYVVYARQIAHFLARAYTYKSYPEIGRRIGGRDHTVVLHSIGKITPLMRSNWCVAYDIAHIERML